MFTVLLGLGSNIGDREKNLSTAIISIEQNLGAVQKKSSLYETEAWGVENQANYLNLVVELKTPTFPLELLEKLLQIETALGRVREKKWESRIIDIDILLFENYIISTDKLQIPHPFLHKRNFVLEPLAEISPNLFHPKLRKPIIQLISESDDNTWIKKI